ncbi:hypothetical protein SAMN04490244_10648 [Tranquillimonas rosea]|uniref:Flp pilus assembly protein, pilin Flp n=1 Tax=Tranquillimonas rosea TaxID=641238 RepID=A0A1H9UXB7_9RHOB|nr:hypothetical protein [Tranquillimonas rosea]SES13744.1 hypothetical protein SAMN04490244_10648 [Tranquillimonas rosea]
MDFFKLYKKFQKDEDGAVTVDWVVLTAAIVGLGIAVISSVNSGVTDLADGVKSSLTDAEVNGMSDLSTAATSSSSGTGDDG